jgi:branched-chain amino acid aminotransferase
MNSIPIIDHEAWQIRSEIERSPLYAMYASTTEAITTDPQVMTVPVDDHLVHRGDGVFESFKCVEGSIYNLSAHLERLAYSAEAIGLDIPYTRSRLVQIIVETIRAGGQRDALIRLLLSRGVGTMGINPAACSGEQLYVVVYPLNASGGVGAFSAGVHVVTSAIPPKPGFFARVKSCNYLPNVLMKKEALEADAAFSVSIDEQGCLGEGATENFGIVSADQRLLMPPPERVLAGTTAKRAMEAAEVLVDEGLLAAAVYEPIPMEEVRRAKEMHVYGTTPNITPVITLDGAPVGDGKAGHIAQRLYEMMRVEMLPQSERLTRVFE